MEYMIFSDGSVDPVKKIGFGAYLLMGVHEALGPDELKQRLKTKRFEDVGSTQLELLTVLWALEEVDKDVKLTLYTDSQHLVRLPARRQRLEQKDYHNKKGAVLRNTALYKTFFQVMDTLDCHFIKVKGHQKAIEKSIEGHYFACVDKAARAALRFGTMK